MLAQHRLVVGDSTEISQRLKALTRHDLRSRKSSHGTQFSCAPEKAACCLMFLVQSGSARILPTDHASAAGKHNSSDQQSAAWPSPDGLRGDHDADGIAQLHASPNGLVRESR